MTGRIVVFGATGYTGRLSPSASPAPASAPCWPAARRSGCRRWPSELGGLRPPRRRHASNSVFSLVDEGDVLVTTVGPFSKWGEPAVRAAITARAAYIDSTGEPAFIRRVFENHGPRRAGRGVPLLTAMGYDFVPGALAGALALEAPARTPYGSTSATSRWDGTQSGSAGTRRRSSAPRSTAPRVPRRQLGPSGPPSGCGRSRSRTRNARRCRSAAPSTSGSRPPIRGCRRSTSTSAGSARSRGRCRPAHSSARSPPGCPACARR